ncbi:MAG: CDP-alcohol phosphatidyltransferase family protein [Lentisphaerae bacterium]|nr:CDP-alcohol phosphatidyltransferase family protein [Lentisphaerota bacterium]
MADKSRELALVTLLTVARFPLILLFFAGALYNTMHPSAALFWGSLAALILSAVTDLFDGWLARRYQVETPFGAHADPLMDKFFFLSTLPLLVYITRANNHNLHAVILLILTLAFLTRDQWVTFLRSIGSIYQASGKAHWAGKVRTAINFPLIAAIYIHEESPLRLIPLPLIYAAEAVAFLVNAISIYTYTRHYWPFLRRAAALHDQRNSAE